MMNSNCFRAKQHPCTGVFGHFADPVVQLQAGHRTAGRRERRAGPVNLHVAAEPAHLQAAVAEVDVQPVGQAQPLQLGNRARRQAVAAGFVTGEACRVNDQHIVARAGGPGGRR
jgi:hypothetical protein